MDRIFQVAVGMVLSLSCVGCGSSGPALGSVSGTVTLDGQPYPNGLVTFSPEGGGMAATGITDASGRFELISGDQKGAVLGKHKVSVTTIQEPIVAAPPMKSDDPEYAKQGDQSAYKKAAQFKEKIPPRYNAKTELTQEVTSGSNDVKLDLKSS